MAWPLRMDEAREVLHRLPGAGLGEATAAASTWRSTSRVDGLQVVLGDQHLRFSRVVNVMSGPRFFQSSTSALSR